PLAGEEDRSIITQTLNLRRTTPPTPGRLPRRPSASLPVVRQARKDTLASRYDRFAITIPSI
ncbi:hypothetical protein, partial [Robertkochia sediminum]|uniref:hypothetical protein n=1 Tax=Robertkochia sediminum TaxID=2785326 RepID=UPI001F3FB371